MRRVAAAASKATRPVVAKRRKNNPPGLAGGRWSGPGGTRQSIPRESAPVGAGSLLKTATATVGRSPKRKKNTGGRAAGLFDAHGCSPWGGSIPTQQYY